MAEFHYPDETDPVISYTPEGPDVGSLQGVLLGVQQQRAGDGEPQSDIRHDPRGRFVRLFKAQPEAMRISREQFFAATRGLPFRYKDDSLPGFITVKATGQSLEDLWTSTEGEDLWERPEELEETTEMPNLSDFGDTRMKAEDFTGTDIRKTFVWPQPFEDADYEPIVTSCLGSDGNFYPAFPDLTTKLAGSIQIVLQTNPGDGVTVHVVCLAVHQ